MLTRCFPVLALLLGGCGQVEIVTLPAEGKVGGEAGSEARLHVLRHHDEIQSADRVAVHLHSVRIDGVSYSLDSETTTFLILPGKHQVVGEFEDCIGWPCSWFRSPVPHHVNLANFQDLNAEAGRTYTMICRPAWLSGPAVAVRFEPE